MLKSNVAVTGGTAGLSLLLSYATPLSFGLIYVAANIPFILLGLRKKGVNFSVRTLMSIALVAGFSYLHPIAFDFSRINEIYGVLAGNLLAGVGILILFRHNASLGGLNIIALLAQERLGWRAGYVQMALDLVIIVCAFAVIEPAIVVLSAVGAIVLNTVLAMNHRPDRYVASS